MYWQYWVWPALHKFSRLCSPTVVMMSLRYRCQKSTLADSPGAHDGLYTAPTSNDLPFSGWIGDPAEAEPAVMVLACCWFFTLVLTKLPSAGTLTQAGSTGLPV